MAPHRLVPGWLSVLTAGVLMAQTGAPAWAQDASDDEMIFDPRPVYEDGEEQELVPDPDPVEDTQPGSEVIPTGALENPHAPPVFGDRRAPPPVVPTTGYPQMIVSRPLTLPAGMSEVSAASSLFVAPLRLTSLLEGSYGVDDRLELGLGYGPVGMTSEGSVAGQAVSLQARYSVFPWMSVQADLPVLLNPFALGLTLGVPLKFRFGGKVALTLGEELVSIRLWKFVPLVGDPARTQDELVEPSRINQIMPAGELRLVGRVLVQRSQQMTWIFETGWIAPDFSLAKSGMPLIAGLVYSPTGRVDLSVRLGFESLEDALDNLALGARLAVRLGG